MPQVPCTPISIRGRGRTSSLPTNATAPPFTNMPYAPTSPDSFIFPSVNILNLEQRERATEDVLEPLLPAADTEDGDSLSTSAVIEGSHAGVEARGGEIHLFAQHRQQDGFDFPSQNHLWASMVHPQLEEHTSYPQSQHSSVSGRVSGRSHPSECGGSGVSHPGTKPTLLSYDKRTRDVVRAARTAAVNDMLLEVGWLYGDSMRVVCRENLKENLYTAGNKLGYRVEWDENIGFMIGKGPTQARSKLAEFADSYTQQYLECPDPAVKADQVAMTAWKTSCINQITDQNDPAHFFLHEHDPNGHVIRYFGNDIFERFHLDFWYTQSVSPIRYFKSSYQTTPVPMYAMSATALLCALHRERSGRQPRHDATLHFKGDTYGPHYDSYRDGIIKLLHHNEFGLAFRERLEWLNMEGMKKLDANSNGLGSACKVAPVFIPESVQATLSQPPSSESVIIPGEITNTSEPTLYFNQNFASEPAHPQAGPSLSEGLGNSDGGFDYNYYDFNRSY
ncbi:hypothetical protein J3R83DRAFT_8855 [Lanmaoa asiatica]|nr:hypothetical protein J3R83DRAFT_8855 [Lanmaoa asiatica]